MLLERDMQLPEDMHEPLLALSRCCVDVVGKAGQIIESLDELVEMGFRGKVAEKAEGLLADLNHAEDVTDELGITLVRKLFAHEEDMSPVSVMMWYQNIQWIGDLADHAEKVGNRLRLLIAH